MDQLTLLGGGAAALVVLVGVSLFLRSRARREQRDRLALEGAVRDQLHLPPSLHPVIDPDICIGSLSCITACPEGDILGVVDGVAKLIIGSNCIGHGRCATECPVNAIRLVVGTSERGVDLPEITSHFESSREGIYVVGELGGMGLIKNAITQGLQASSHLAQKLAGLPPSPCDVVIVGAGPAGLATALGLRAAGMSFRIVEQGRFGGTIAHYPRQKVVMTERVQLPIAGRFGKPLMSKEELLESWGKIARKAKLKVEEGVKVEGVEGDDGRFVVQTSGGTIETRKVVLATGRRGSPRALGVPGEDLPKVTYNLDDPEQYAKSRVLVVGGGDSAIEAACMLAERQDVEVAISYRQASFSKCREANRQKIAAMIEAGDVHAFMGSSIERVDKSTVLIVHEQKRIKLPNDWVIACLGGELPSGFLKKVGVDIVRHFGEHSREHSLVPAPSAPAAARAAAAGKAAAPAKRGKKKPKQRTYLGLGLFIIGASILAGLVFAGQEYYLLGRAARMRSPLHAAMRPSGWWGHGIGIIATLFMMSNFLYPMRKRLGFMKGSAPIKSWLTFHVFVGIMSPLVIVFHAAFQSRNQLATATFVSLLVVVVTGLVGRFVFGMVPSAEGKALEMSMVRAHLERELQGLQPLVTVSKSAARLRELIEQLSREPERRGSLFMHLLGTPARWLGDRATLLKLRSLFDKRDDYQEFARTFLVVRKLHTQVTFYASLRRLLSGWRAFHVVLSILLVVIITAHVGLSVYLGYKWIF